MTSPTIAQTVAPPVDASSRVHTESAPAINASAAAAATADSSLSRSRTWRRRFDFGSVLLTVVQLAALGLLGSIAFGLVIGLFGAGIGSLLALGVGLVILVGLVYLLFGIAWFENERVRLLYGFDSGSLHLRQREKPGFSGWARSIAKQSIDGSMWRAIMSFTIGSCFGLAIIWLLQLAAWWITVGSGGGSALGRPMNFIGDLSFDWIAHPGWAFLAAGLAVAASLALAWWHAAIARSLLGSLSRSALAAAVQQKSAQREGAVRAADVERTRIERDLHDGVQPRLVSIGMTLGLAQQKIENDPSTAKKLIEEAHTSTKAAITELRQLARGIHASVLDDRGLDAAFSALAGRSHIPVRLDVRLEGRPAARAGANAASSPGQSSYRDAEAAVYFCIAEALTNAAKHSRAAECRVVVRPRDPGTTRATIWARVEDNGIGGASAQPGGGLDGISNRVLAMGGTFTLVSPQGGPTTLEVSVPCAF